MLAILPALALVALAAAPFAAILAAVIGWMPPHGLFCKCDESHTTDLDIGSASGQNARMPTFPHTLPTGAAGTILPDGAVISGDDFAAWHWSGWTTERAHVLCSARIADGAQDVPAGWHRCAIDCNGADIYRIAAIVLSAGCSFHSLTSVHGAYDGTVSPAALLTLPGASIPGAHAALLSDLPGFGCFAVFTPLDNVHA